MSLAHPVALWLFPAAVAALVLLQLWQGRRREHLAGSLLVWRRVAAQETARPPRHIVLDPPFWLQAGTLLAVTLALAGPSLRAPSPPGRRLALVVDNGPAARARRPDGTRAWEDVRTAAREVLAGLEAQDRVILLPTAPLTRALPLDEGWPPAEALAQLDRLAPALSGPDVEAAWVTALEQGRLFETAANAAPVLVISPRPAPSGAEADPRARWHTVGPGPGLANVGLTAFGAELREDGGAEVLVQVRSFAPREMRGQVALETDGKNPEAQRLALAPGGVQGVLFRLPAGPLPSLRLTWRGEAGPDALPEDDELTALPRAAGSPRVRFHGAAPHLEDLYREALGAKILALDAPEPADLEVFVESLPPAKPPANGAYLLLAPLSEFGPFEVLPQVLERPVARLGAQDALTRYMTETPEGLGWFISRARALRQVGDLRVLVQDAEGHVLAARFRLKDGRPGYVLALVPGEQTPRERKLDPALAALLVRLLREAAGLTEPYAVETAAQLERAAGTPLPLDWRPQLDAAGRTGQGVLDPRASALDLGRADAAPPALSGLLPTPRAVTHPLWPWLVCVAVVLLLWETARSSRG
jgi:hypothetical protein